MDERFFVSYSTVDVADRDTTLPELLAETERLPNNVVYGTMWSMPPSGRRLAGWSRWPNRSCKRSPSTRCRSPQWQWVTSCSRTEGLLARPNLRNRRLFDTTNIEDSVMAAPASRGLSRPSAANGSAAML